ncbi:AraC family transcriptional regulator [Nocardia crassostreae]|uniref:AraC family transcriptional regulator n=1 Tax=Nocardia crassostreae TaxID=53428 RepID=UPI001C3F6ECB|nr:helix-turn-helix domain-containing protein [Nocardia crassostreae]
MTTLERPATVVTAELFEHATTPPESLRPWIAEVGHIPTVFEPFEPFTHIPHAVTTIVVRTEPSGRSEALVVGPQTRATYSTAKKPAGCLRLRLAPGASRPLLGLPAADLADRALPLGEVPGPAAEFAAALTELGPEDALGFLEQALPHRISEDAIARDHRRLLAAAVDSLLGAPAPVGALAADLAVSERQLRNLFATGIGVSPKHFARIARIRRIVAATPDAPWSPGTVRDDRNARREPQPSHARLAADNGFYDQSHMVADFRSVMGVTPDRFFKGRLPAPAPCRALISPGP